MLLSQAPSDSRGDLLADVVSAALLPEAHYKGVEARAPWGMRVPAGDRAVFYLLAHGRALLEVDGEAPRTLAAGDIAFFPNGSAHALRDAPGSRLIPSESPAACPHPGPAQIGGGGAPTTLLAGFFEHAPRSGPALLRHAPRVAVLPARPWVEPMRELVLAELAEPGPASGLVLQRIADVVFVQMLRHLSTCRHNGSRGALAHPRVHRALELMHARPGERWTVEQLAASVGESRSGFAARFVQATGESPRRYLARWRMVRAAELLRDTDDSIASVAERVGYESVPSFCKAFKRWHQASPGTFRRRGSAATRRTS